MIRKKWNTYINFAFRWYETDYLSLYNETISMQESGHPVSADTLSRLYAVILCAVTTVCYHAVHVVMAMRHYDCMLSQR